jgi:hypothetical protein
LVKVSKSAAKDSAQVQGDESEDGDEEDTSGLDDEDSENPLSLDPSSADNIMPGVDKVTIYFTPTLIAVLFLILFSAQENCSCCSFKPAAQEQLVKIKSSLMTANDPTDKRKLLMLILDVKTRWSSTHQMLGMYLLFNLINFNF